jgi:hypothetical protein
MRLAEPMDRELRDPFLKAVAIELRSHQGPVDSGLAHRVGKSLQREFLPGFVAPSRLAWISHTIFARSPNFAERLLAFLGARRLVASGDARGTGTFPGCGGSEDVVSRWAFG